MKKCKQCEKELNSYYKEEFCSRECQRTFTYKKKCKILIPTSCRSDDPLTRPMIDLIKKDKFFDMDELFLIPGNFEESYHKVDSYFNIINQELLKKDCILIMGDRIEMFAAAVAAFHNNVPIIHYGSGITNTIATFDDINRHSIALMADVCLCETFTSAMNVAYLWEIINKKEPSAYFTDKILEDNNIHVVGNLYLETLNDIDESLVPDYEYDLVLYNPTTLYKEEIIDVMRKRFGNNTVWIGSNPDPSFIDLDFKSSEAIWSKIRKNSLNFYNYFGNLPRARFLGLLKNCQRFITNSSSAYYEAPYFLKPEQIVLVGNRNRNRSTPMKWDQDYKTSEKIVQIIKVQIIKEWGIKKNE